MIIKCGIPEVFRGTISDDITSVIDFVAEIEKRFAKTDKAKTSTPSEPIRRKQVLSFRT